MELIDGKHLGPYKLMPAKSGKCTECAEYHRPEEPHNKSSLYYQYYFYNEHGRWPNWNDAMAHCSEETKKKWIKALTDLGERIDMEVE